MARHRVKKEDTLDPEELQDYLSKRKERRKERNASKKQSKILSRQLYAQKKEFCCVGESNVVHVLRKTQHTRAGTGEAFEILRPLCNCQTHTSNRGCMLVTGPSEVYVTKASESNCTRCLKMLEG